MNNRGAARRRAGIVLAVVLWATALFEVLVVGMLSAARFDLRRGQYRLDRVRALALAEGGIERVTALLSQDQNTWDGLNEAWSLGPTRSVTFRLPAEAGEPEGAVAVSIEDEGGKLNLNAVPATQMRKFLSGRRIPGEETVFDSLLDWQDPDESPRLHGAEDDWYLRQPRPYHAKNAPLDTVGELKLIRGMTDPAFRLISPYLTVYGPGRVNLNTAPFPVLASLPGMDDVLARRIVEYRSGGDGVPGTPDDRPFLVPDQARVLVGSVYDRFADLVTVTSTDFSVRSVARVGRATAAVQAVLSRTMVSGIRRVETRLWREE